jgi:hypothetical protein
MQPSPETTFTVDLGLGCLFKLGYGARGMEDASEWRLAWNLISEVQMVRPV